MDRMIQIRPATIDDADAVVQRICAVRNDAPGYLASRGLDGGA